MTTVDFVIALGVVSCLFLVAYTYIGYPILVWMLAKCFGRNEIAAPIPEDKLPCVSLLIVAYNEEAEIEQRILNALALDYPAEKLEIVIASDGSDDGTNDIVRRYANRNVRLLDYTVRRGKSSVLNDSFAELKHEIVVLSDANTSFNSECIRHLTSWFADSSVGVVCGRLVLTDPRSGRNIDSVYWKYETFLKKCESKLGALLGSNGGIYAIRKSHFFKIAPNTIVDDFVIPLTARQKTGCRIVYDRNAVACEETPENIRSEFRRRSRIGAGGFQSIGRLRGLLNPRCGWVSFTFFSHKILRWLCPFFMLGALLLNVALLLYPPFQILLIAQLSFYAGSLLATQLPTKPRFLRYFKLGTMFTMMNAALFLGFFVWLLRTQKGTWQRTDRLAGKLIVNESRTTA